MTNKEAIDWIDILIKEMKRDTSGQRADPEYKDEVYEALDKAKDALKEIDDIKEATNYSEGYSAGWISGYNQAIDQIFNELNSLIKSHVIEELRKRIKR